MESVPPSSIGSCCMAMDLLIYVWYAHGSRWFPYSMWWFWKSFVSQLGGLQLVKWSGNQRLYPPDPPALRYTCTGLPPFAPSSVSCHAKPRDFFFTRSVSHPTQPKTTVFFKGLIGHLLLENWLVVWNMNFIFPYIGNNNPIWLIFFRGVETTNQVGKSLLGSCWIAVHAVVPWVGILGCRLFV